MTAGMSGPLRITTTAAIQVWTIDLPHVGNAITDDGFIAAKAGSFSDDGRVNVRVTARSGTVELEVGPLQPGGADGLIASAELPGVGNVLERVADVLEPQQRDGDEGPEDRLGQPEGRP